MSALPLNSDELLERVDRAMFDRPAGTPVPRPFHPASVRIVNALLAAMAPAPQPLAEVLLEPGSIRRIGGRDWQIVASVGDRLIAVPADTPTLTIPEEDA